jgi:hypothetical protein
LFRTPYPYSDRRVRGSPEASGVGQEKDHMGSHSLLKEPNVILLHHTVKSLEVSDKGSLGLAWPDLVKFFLNAKFEVEQCVQVRKVGL